MSKRVHSKVSFQEKWLDNIKYKTWLAQAPLDKNTARCILCKKDINISTMGVSAIQSHAAGKRHTDLLIEKKSIKMYFLFQVSLQTQTRLPARNQLIQVVPALYQLVRALMGSWLAETV